MLLYLLYFETSHSLLPSKSALVRHLRNPKELFICAHRSPVPPIPMLFFSSFISSQSHDFKRRNLKRNFQLFCFLLVDYENEKRYMASLGIVQIFNIFICLLLPLLLLLLLTCEIFEAIVCA